MVSISHFLGLHGLIWMNGIYCRHQQNVKRKIAVEETGASVPLSPNNTASVPRALKLPLPRIFNKGTEEDYRTNLEALRKEWSKGTKSAQITLLLKVSC